MHPRSSVSSVAATSLPPLLLFYCAVEYAKVPYTLDSSISVQASSFWRFVEHLGLPCESFTVQAVREFFPRLLLCDSLTYKCAAAVKKIICSSYLYVLLARSPATTTAAVAQSLTTDSPVTQLNFHSFRLCVLHTPIHTMCVSFITPHHPLVSLLRCIEYSEKQHPRLLQHLHRRQDVGREEVCLLYTSPSPRD